MTTGRVCVGFNTCNCYVRWTLIHWRSGHREFEVNEWIILPLSRKIKIVHINGNIPWSHITVVGFVLDNQGSVPGRSSSLRHNFQTCSRTNPTATEGSLSDRGVKVTPPHSAEIKNAWSYTSTPHTSSWHGTLLSRVRTVLHYVVFILFRRFRPVGQNSLLTTVCFHLQNARRCTVVTICTVYFSIWQLCILPRSVFMGFKWLWE
jgi:hypothetical protein